MPSISDAPTHVPFGAGTPFGGGVVVPSELAALFGAAPPERPPVSFTIVIGLVDADDVMEVLINGAKASVALGVLLEAVDDDREGLAHMLAEALVQTRHAFSEKYPGYHIGAPDSTEDGRMTVEVHDDVTDQNVRPTDLPEPV